MDSIDLTGLVIENEFGIQGVTSIVEVALDGSPIIFEETKTTGIPFDLVGFGDMGWIDRATLLILKALADVPYATYNLRYEGELKRVRFRNEDGPVIQADQLVPRSNPDSTDWYNNIRIKLMEL